MSIIDANLKELTELRELCISQNRDPNNEERARANFLLAEIDIKESDFFFNHEGPDKTPIDTRYEEGYKPASAYAREAGKPYSVRTGTDRKDYRALYGESDNEYRWTDKESNFFDVLFSGRFHPDLVKRALNETTPSSGGFLIPVEYSEKIHNVSLENELVMPRCTIMPMKSNELHLPGFAIGDHSSNLFGGFSATYVAEEGSLTEANPLVRDVILKTKKLTGLLKFSNELFADSVNGERQILDTCGKGLSWFRDKAFLKGSGAGEPLGILNAGCTLVQAEASGQAADTVLYSNLTGMLSKLHPASFKNSVWVCHQSTIPQLLELSIAVGTGGAHVPVMTESNGEFKMLTRPCIFSEKTEPLGDQGDVLLADFSQYIVGLNQEMRIDLSQHVFFTTDMGSARLIERHDGLPLWDEALTLEDGSTQTSPFIVLAERT